MLLLVCLDFCVLCEVTITSLCSVSVQTRKNIFAGVGIIGNLHCVELLDTTHCHLLLERWEIISISLQSTHFLHGKTHYQYSIPIARIKANSHSTKHIVVSHSHTYKNVQFQGSLFASRSNNMYLWKSIIRLDIERSSNKNIQIYSINECKRGRVFMELVLSLCHCQWWDPTHHTLYNTSEYGWMWLISNIPATIPPQYRLWGNSEMRILDPCDKVEDLIRQRKLTDLDCSRVWKAAEERREHHISDTRSWISPSSRSYLCRCYKINWGWWIGVWMSNSRYTI